MKNKGLIGKSIEILGSKEKRDKWLLEIDKALQKRSNSGTEVEDAILKPLRDYASKQKSGLKKGDKVILKPKSAPMLYDGHQFEREHFKELDTKHIQGTIMELQQMNNHYCWGEYASINWDNKTRTDSINTSWLEKVK